MEAQQDINNNNNNNDNHRSKKRKPDDENDDQKVEEFFALLRSTREARDRLRSKDISDAQNDRQQLDRNGKVNEDVVGRRREKSHGVWCPTFRPEDFLDDDKLLCFGGGTGQSESKMEVDNHKEDIDHDNNGDSAGNNKNNIISHDLDLNLSL